MQDGASEYLTKDNVSEELIKSLYQLRSGKKYISSEFSYMCVTESYDVKTQQIIKA